MYHAENITIIANLLSFQKQNEPVHKILVLILWRVTSHHMLVSFYNHKTASENRSGLSYSNPLCSVTV